MKKLLEIKELQEEALKAKQAATNPLERILMDQALTMLFLEEHILNLQLRVEVLEAFTKTWPITGVIQ